MNTFDEIMNLLSQYGQEHLLAHYNELSEPEKASLISQIEKIDFSVLECLDESKRASAKRGTFTPLGAVTVSDIECNSEEYRKIGCDVIKSGKAAAVLLAGGQGTRLGFDKPKGMFNVGVTRDLYIFQCLINNLMKVVKETGAWVQLYIMTSEKNHEDTTSFFKEKNFFGYDPDHISFFIQDMTIPVRSIWKPPARSPHRLTVTAAGSHLW